MALIRCFWQEEQQSSTNTRDLRPITGSCPRISVIIKWVALILPVLEEVISPSRYQHFRLMSLLNCSLVKRAMCSLVSLRDLASLCQCWSPPYSCRLVNRWCAYVSAFEDSFSIWLCVKVPFRCWLFPWRLSPSSSRWNATGSASRHCLEAR